MYHKLLLLALLTSLSFRGISQANRLQPNTLSFNEVFGLHEKTIYDVLETDEGLYLGSNSGLHYFDGDSIHTYHLNGYPVEYTNLQQDPKGNIWFSNFYGQVFQLKNKSIQLLVDRSSETNFLISYDLSFYPKVLIIDEKSISTFHIEQKIPGLESFVEGGNVYYSENFALLANNSRFTVLKITPKLKLDTLGQFSLNIRRKLEFLTQGEQLILCNINNSAANFYSFSLTANKFLGKQFTLEGELFSFNRFQKVNDSTIGYLSKKGFQLINTNPWKLRHQFPQLPNFSCSKYMTLSGGIHLLSTLNSGVQLIPNPSFKNLSFKGKSIKTYAFSKEDLFFLDQGGQLWKLNLTSLELLACNFKNLYTAQIFYDPQKEWLLFGEGNQAYDITKDKAIDFKLFKFKHLEKVNNTYYGTYSHALLKGGKAGFVNDRDKRCNFIAFDSANKHLFVDFIDGLKLKELQLDTFITLKGHKDENVFVTVLQKSNRGGVWAFTSGRRLFKFKGDSILLTKKFDDNYKYLEETDEKIFLANDQEIVSWDLKTNQLKKVDSRAGLLKKEILGLKAYKGNLIILNPSGIQFLALHQERSKNIQKPRFHIESIYINGKEVDQKRLKNLSYKENNLGIHFKSLHIASLSNEKVEYRIIEQGKAWKQAPAERGVLEFPQLSSGEYHFEFRACDPFANCSAVASLSLIIHKPWFETGWFYFSVFLLLILIVFIISRAIIRHNLYLEKLEREKETAEKERQLSKIKAIQAQMNPHFVFNALNSIQDYILSNQKELASEYLADFADLVRSYLRQTQQDELEVAEEVETLQEYLKLEKLRLGDDFKYSIVFKNEEELIKGIHIPVMLIQPFVENSIKHGLLPKKGDRELLISFEIQADRLVIAICDNGIGVSASLKQNKKGVGLSFGNKAIQDKIALLNKHQKLEVEVKHLEGFNNQGVQGTRVILSLKTEELPFPPLSN
ncbi:MAG: histidine kinase [Vicingaceae bacterium]